MNDESAGRADSNKPLAPSSGAPDPRQAGGRAGAPDPRQTRGRAGEALACSFLEEHGYEILETNYRSRYGEIDIIARRGEVVAFIEVKTRRGGSFGQPFEAVDRRKQSQIRRMAAMWTANLQSSPVYRSFRECSFRFDVISVFLRDDKSPAIRHMEDAFR